MKCVILAGGRGTRISELTKNIPKPMIKISGKPILYHIMKHYSNYGVKDFIVAAGYKKNIIINYFIKKKFIICGTGFFGYHLCKFFNKNQSRK